VAVFVVGAALVHGHSGSPASATPVQSQPSAGYERGVAGWDTFRAWVAVQPGDRRAGIDYWGANRSARGHASCVRAAEAYNGDQREFATGCEEAMHRLGAIDAERRDAQYRAGFNDEAQRSPL
jgi:hypothetical protein